MTADNQSLPPLPESLVMVEASCDEYGPRKLFASDDYYTVEQMQAYGDARAAHARKVALEEAANACEELSFTTKGPAPAAQHQRLLCASAIRGMK